MRLESEVVDDFVQLERGSLDDATVFFGAKIYNILEEDVHLVHPPEHQAKNHKNLEKTDWHGVKKFIHVTRLKISCNIPFA